MKEKAMTDPTRFNRPSRILTACAALLLLLAAAATAPSAKAAEIYNIDTKGQHAFIEFRIKHLGFSWLYGRFNEFGGNFIVDRDDPANSSVTVEIATASVDTNHAERDKHLRDKDFLDVDAHPKAVFQSTKIIPEGDTIGVIEGTLTLNGVTRPIEVAVEEIGHGPDPWGGYRAGFHGTTTLTLADFGIDYDLGPASRTVEMTLSIEGIRQ
jgi:polyisoprenoid-binding protein YceI